MEYNRETGKKWLRSMAVTFAGLLCTAMLVLFQAVVAYAAEIGTVTAGSANIRAESNTSSNVVASVVNGDKLEIIGEVTGADGKVWYNVIVDADTTGFIRSDLIQKSEEAENTGATANLEGVSEVQPVSASVVRDQVRVRADSTTNSSIVTMVQQDAVLTVQGTKSGNGDEVWYLVSFVDNGAEVKGYVRSDFVTLNGELLPVVETPPAEVPEEQQPVTPEVPVEEPKAFETQEEEGVWWLLNIEENEKYKISELITSAEQNAKDLEKAQKQVSKQNGIIIFLSILVVVMVLGVTLLIFKIRDMKEDEGFDEIPVRRPSNNNGSRPTRPTGNTNRQPNRPSGSKPTGTNGSRPAGASGNRPAGASGSRPANGQSGRPAGNRPATGGGEGKPANTGARPSGARPATGNTGARVEGAKPVVKPENAKPASAGGSNKPDNQPKAHVKNFMSDDEFEFEFLNWDGEEDK